MDHQPQRRLKMGMFNSSAGSLLLRCCVVAFQTVRSVQRVWYVKDFSWWDLWSNIWWPSSERFIHNHFTIPQIYEAHQKIYRTVFYSKNSLQPQELLAMKCIVYININITNYSFLANSTYTFLKIHDICNFTLCPKKAKSLCWGFLFFSEGIF